MYNMQVFFSKSFLLHKTAMINVTIPTSIIADLLFFYLSIFYIENIALIFQRRIKV